MDINTIIDLSNIECIKLASDEEIYCFSMILMTVSQRNYDCCFGFMANQGFTLMREGDETRALPDPPEYGTSCLRDLLTNKLPLPVERRDLGGFSGIRLFKLHDQIMVALFAEEREGDNHWVSLRLLYGDSAPSSATNLLMPYSNMFNEKSDMLHEPKKRRNRRPSSESRGSNKGTFYFSVDPHP